MKRSCKPCPIFSEIFGDATFDSAKKEVNITSRGSTIRVKLNQKKAPGSTNGGVIDTKIQEEGTTVVLNAVLHKIKNSIKRKIFWQTKKLPMN